MTRPQFIYIHESHLDLFWIGDYRYCLERGQHVIKQYLDRCLEHEDEAFLLETVVFLEHFLRKHPEYESTVKELWQRGQLDVGAAYIDILEHLALGESHVRNIVRGKLWCRRKLGIDTRLAAHTDLPSLIPQVAQIYPKAEVPYYITSRKVFPNGAVWAHRAPDGSTMLVFNHPLHYDFRKLKRNADAYDKGRGWDKCIDPDKVLEGFPLGKVVLSAGAGDQADVECFKTRYGKSAREFLEEYRTLFPEVDFSFGAITPVMDDYASRADELPHLEGEIPSVWGLSSVDPDFFKRGRRLEGTLLAAEMLDSIGRWHGLPPVAQVRKEWYGTLYEKLYFLGRDPVPRGGELEELWKMHLFVYDHNFSGNYAPQTQFDKRCIQERALSYAEEMVGHYVDCIAGSGDGPHLFVLNPLNWERREPVEVAFPRSMVNDALRLADASGRAVPWQAATEAPADSENACVVLAPSVPGTAYAMLTVRQGGGHVQRPEAAVHEDCEAVRVCTDRVEVTVDKRSGAVTGLRDRKTGADWGGPHVGRLYAARELGCDVPLNVDESAPLDDDTVESVRLSALGPLFAAVTITKSILKAHVTQDIVIWGQDMGAVDMRTTVLWHGQHKVQMRQCLPTAGRKEDVSYGTPFYGNNWCGVLPGSGPRNPDEMASREHWDDYRELQLWVHQKGRDSALAMSSLHATYHWGGNGLEAVLMRTTPSCADDRFYWEHAGRRQYAFRFRFTEPDAPLSVPARMGQEAMRPLLGRLVHGKGDGAFPLGSPFVALDGDGLILSAVCPDGDDVIVRFFEADGKRRRATIRMALARRLQRVTLLGEALEDLPGTLEGWAIEVGPYEIVTLRATR
jgi:hypothetical protein